MKTQKIFLLAIALVLAIFMLASCDAAQTAPDCFVFDEESSFAGEPSEVEGEIIAVNEEYNLVAFETWSLGTTDGYTNGRIKVVDVSDKNRVVYQRGWGMSPDSSTTDYNVDLSAYPVIKVSHTYHSGYDTDGDPIYTTSYEYYLIHEDREATYLSSSSKGDTIRVESVNNIWLVLDNTTLYWVNRNLEVMRQIPADISDTYLRLQFMDPERYFQFEAEYCDYLYTWEFDAEKLSQVVIVYDPNGIACAKYSPSYRGFAPTVKVLNNGNVLIQEQQIVEDGEDYDYLYPNGLDVYKMNLVTKIMDYKTGVVTEVEFNYIIQDLESNYTATEISSDFPFTLAEGYANQAYLVPIANGVIGNETKYVVINDSLEIVWSLNNRYLEKTGVYLIGMATETGYSAYALIDGEEVVCFFDWLGNITFTAPTNAEESSKEYYTTESGIYDFNGKLVFDIENSEFCDAKFEFIGERIYFYKTNDKTAEKYQEVYIFNFDTKSPELIADGKDTEFKVLTKDGAYAITNNRKSLLTVYDRNGDVALITRTDVNLINAYSCANAYVVNVEVGGEYKAYVLTYGDQAAGRAMK